MSIEQFVDLTETKEALRRALRDLERLRRERAELVEAVYQAAKDAASSIQIPPVKPPVKDKRKGTGEVATVLLSDWQLGKTTPDYTSDVARERISLLADKVITLSEIQRADHPVRECHLILAGDLVEGELIFPGQAHRIDSSLFRQAMVNGPEILADFIRRMAGSFETVKITGVIGNHGRIGGRSSRDMHPESNADTIMMEAARLITSGIKNVSWAPTWTPDERHWYAVAEIAGHRVMIVHGDQIRGGFGGFPFYGYMKKALGWYTSVERFDYLVTGHWHTPTRLTLGPGITVWVNGSTESTNTYAQENLAAAGRPAQWLLFMHPQHGVTAEYLVHLDGGR